MNQILNFSKDARPCVTPQEISAVEERRQVKFPSDYIELLLTKDGEYLEDNWNFNINHLGSQIACELENIYSLKEVDEFWDLYVASSPDDQDIFGEGFSDGDCLQCIGMANGGDKLCLGLKNSYYGKIYLFEPTLHQDFIFVANSLTEFLGMLKRES